MVGWLSFAGNQGEVPRCYLPVEQCCQGIGGLLSTLWNQEHQLILGFSTSPHSLASWKDHLLGLFHQKILSQKSDFFTPVLLPPLPTASRLRTADLNLSPNPPKLQIIRKPNARRRP